MVAINSKIAGSCIRLGTVAIQAAGGGVDTFTVDEAFSLYNNITGVGAVGEFGTDVKLGRLG